MKKSHIFVLWGEEKMQPLKLDYLLCWCKVGKTRGDFILDSVSD
jgi:hypothetical protein